LRRPPALVCHAAGPGLHGVGRVCRPPPHGGIPQVLRMRYSCVTISPASDAGRASGGPPRPPPTLPARCWRVRPGSSPAVNASPAHSGVRRSHIHSAAAGRSGRPASGPVRQAGRTASRDALRAGWQAFRGALSRDRCPGRVVPRPGGPAGTSCGAFCMVRSRAAAARHRAGSCRGKGPGQARR
jgi:hypothetical protein